MIQFKVGDNIPKSSKITTEIVEGQIVVTVSNRIITGGDEIRKIVDENEVDSIFKSIEALYKLLLIRAATLKNAGFDHTPTYKYYIFAGSEKTIIGKTDSYDIPRALTFPTESLAHEFIENEYVIDLISIAKNIIN